MEELTEKRVWQRVRGEAPVLERVRSCLADQGSLLTAYRSFSRRGGPWRRLYECKAEQVSCLRGLVRVLTGQGAARPGGNGLPDLMACFDRERRLLLELTELSRDPELGPVFAILRDRQKHLCRLVLELLGA